MQTGRQADRLSIEAWNWKISAAVISCASTNSPKSFPIQLIGDAYMKLKCCLNLCNWISEMLSFVPIDYVFIVTSGHLYSQCKSNIWTVHNFNAQSPSGSHFLANILTLCCILWNNSCTLWGDLLKRICEQVWQSPNLRAKLFVLH